MGWWKNKFASVPLFLLLLCPLLSHSVQLWNPSSIVRPPPPPPQPASTQAASAAAAGQPRHHCIDLTARFATVEYADGVRKEIITVNNKFPGPTIRANLGDKVTIRVRNMLIDKNGKRHRTSVHFHGLEMKETPWWDGPELVTQCPINTNDYMEYSFTLHQCGTYWFHSHTSWQYIDGFWGWFIVDNTAPAPHKYDDEILISLSDWHWKTGAELTDIFHLPTTSSIPNAGVTPLPDSALINGRGSANCSQARAQGHKCNDRLASRVTVFNVRFGNTYRIRLLNPSARASFNFSIDGHKLRVIEIDGVDTVEGRPVDVVEIWPAQRLSFLVTMDSTSMSDTFWIRADMFIIANALKADDKARIGRIRPLATLHYLRARPTPFEKQSCKLVDQRVIRGMSSPRGSPGGGGQGRPSCRMAPWLDPVVNWAKQRLARVAGQCQFVEPTENQDKCQTSVDKKCIQGVESRRNPRPVCLDDKNCLPYPSSHCEGDTPPQQVDFEVVLTARLSNDTFGFDSWSFSNHSYNTKELHVPAIFNLVAPEPVQTEFVPQYVPFAKNIQVIINNLNGGAHPYHLHGHTFWVIAAGAPGQGAFNQERDGWRLLNQTAIKRDTTHANPHSWLVVRFNTDNPGAWLLHCHIHWHFDRGLGTVLVEGESEVPCRYKVPLEARRVCEASSVLIRENPFRKGCAVAGGGGGGGGVGGGGGFVSDWRNPYAISTQQRLPAPPQQQPPPQQQQQPPQWQGYVGGSTWSNLPLSHF